MKQLKLMVAMLVWCGVSAGCVAEETAIPVNTESAAQTVTPEEYDNKKIETKSNASDEKPKYVLTKGKGKPVCDDYVALMNRAEKNPDSYCGLKYNFDDEAKANGFKEINWVEVNPKDHKDMLLKLWMYRNQDYKSDEDKKKKQEEFYKNGYALTNRLWKATFDLNNDGVSDEVYKLGYICGEDNMTLFMPSDIGFSSTNYGKRIDLTGVAFTYKDHTYIKLSTSISETFSGNGRENIPEFVHKGFTICNFEPLNKKGG